MWKFKSPKLRRGPEVNSHVHAAVVATDGVTAERDVPARFSSSSSVFVHLPLPLSLPPPYSSLIYLSSLPATPPLTSVLPVLASLPPVQTINIMSRGWQCSFMEHCMFIRGRRSLREMLTVFINGPHPRLMRHGTS